MATGPTSYAGMRLDTHNFVYIGVYRFSLTDAVIKCLRIIEESTEIDIRNDSRADYTKTSSIYAVVETH